MNVLFLAIGGSRRHVIVAEARQVIDAGGTATVLVGKPAKWNNDPLPEGADMVDWSAFERRYRPAAVRLLIDRIPLFLMRVCLRGPLSGFGRRLQSFYRRRVANPIHRRLGRLYRRNPAEIRERAMRRDVLARRPVDLVVVGDAESMVTASELRDVFVDSGARLAYSVAHELSPAGHAKG
ncbi:hypothetical protein GCM10022254_36910 [Actinomadura meridiana]|uniref:Uncharacterized protein n=1 Tax=Actinomadura meridiana TaxID=559626 RepID=A0ABP8C588_9ACTN